MSKIQGDAAFAGVQACKVGALIGPLWVQLRLRIANLIAFAGPLDFDDIGTHVRE